MFISNLMSEKLDLMTVVRISRHWKMFSENSRQASIWGHIGRQIYRGSFYEER